jgi:TorA maturation chaperone TorD
MNASGAAVLPPAVLPPAVLPPAVLPPAVHPEEQQVARALMRAAVYRLLGGAWAYPTPSHLEDLAALAESVAVDSPLAPVFAAFASAARGADAEATAQEYVFLFDREARCPPYEGAWGDAPQMAGKSALLADIAGFYAAFGLEPSAVHPDAEDHIAPECEFMSALCLKEAYALAEGMTEGLEVTGRAQASFLGEHLGRWAETFAGAVKEATPLPYYGVLADLLIAWVREEIAGVGADPQRVVGRFGYDPVQEEAFTCPMAPASLQEDPQDETA